MTGPGTEGVAPPSGGDGRRVVLTGATGMVGAHVQELCLARPDVAAVTAIGRRPTGATSPKLREVIHADFGDCDPIAAELAGCDVAFFCLGAYTGAVSDDELRRVTVDYAAEFARVLAERSPGAALCLLSGQGADTGERSRIAFARYKGMAENAVRHAGLRRAHAFRPGYIYPVVKRAEPTASYRLFRALYPLLRRVYPNVGVTSLDLARAMVHVGLSDSPAGASVLENRRIRDVAAAAR